MTANGRPIRLLLFSHDASLLEQGSESARRQSLYCELLAQERTIIVMAPELQAKGAVAEGAVRVHAAHGGGRLTRLARAHALGLELARRFQPDAVEYQDPRESGPVALAVARRLDRPVIGGVFHELIDHEAWLRGPRRPIRLLVNRVAHEVMARTRLIRCDSDHVRARLVAAGRGQARMVPFFIPGIAAFEPGGEVGTARADRWADDLRFLAVSRLAPEKGLGDLLDAFASVPRGVLEVIGDGPERGPLEARARASGIAERVTWRGALAVDEVAAAMHRAHILVMASPAEARARVLIEARVAGLPVVATDAAGTREVVRDGNDGIVVPPAQPAQLADALIRLARDRELWNSMNGRVAHDLRRAHGPEGVRLHLAAFYREALA